MARTGETAGAVRRRRRRWLGAAAAVIVAAAFLVYVFVFGGHGYLRSRELARENRRLQGELTELRRENDGLRAELRSLDDPAALEKLAREELGLVRDGEKVYRFLEEEGPATAERKAGGKD